MSKTTILGLNESEKKEILESLNFLKGKLELLTENILRIEFF